MKLEPFLCSMFVALTLASSCEAQSAVKTLVSKGSSGPGSTSSMSDATGAYVRDVTNYRAGEVRSLGSLWTEDGLLSRLSVDTKAAHVHDLIAIVVSESLTASTDGTVKDSRASATNSQISALVGKFSASNTMQNLLNQSSGSSLNAQGQSITDSSLNTIVGGEIISVLPNGMFVIQADREVTFNQQTQRIRLHGVIRPADILPNNQVLSTAISNLEVAVVGKGIVNDATYRANPLARFISKVLVF